jgi:hypothetical protein
LKLEDPAVLADDDPALERSLQLLGTLGARIQRMIADYDANLPGEDQNTRLERDLATLIRCMDEIGPAADRIRARSCGARDDTDAGLVPSARDLAEEEVADWFDREWERGGDGFLPGAIAFERLRHIADNLPRILPVPVKRGRRPLPRAHVRLLGEAADLFEKITDEPASASKANGELRHLRDSSERDTPFLRFVKVLFDAAEIPMVKSESVRIALEARRRRSENPH